MNGYQALLTFLGILVTTGSDLFAKYTRGPGNVYHGRYTRDLHEPEFLIPRRVHGDGSFDTYSLPNFYDRRELNERRKRSTETDKLHLVLPFNGIEHHVELTPYHEFISPDMVIETRGASLRTNLNEAVRFKRASDQQCHYRGFVRGHQASRAALSLCDGVVGYVQTNHGRYFIEPASESEPEQDGQHIHVAYKRNAPHEKDGNHGDASKRRCGTEDAWEVAWAEELAKREKRLIEEGNSGAAKRETPSRFGTHSIHRYIEIGLVADRQFLDFHNNTNYEQFLLTVMNMVSDYYHDGSVGNQIDVVLVRMIYLEKEKEEIDLHISPNASKTLASFAEWSKKVNPADHNHPNHYDIGVLVTRYDICTKKQDCNLMGLAYVAAACNPDKAVSYNEESGLLLGVVIAHEVGHVMGCGHDDAKDSNGPACQPLDKDESYFVMSPIVDLHTIRWSPCSRKYITGLLEAGLGECLNNNPKNPSEKLKIPNMLPGAMYDASYQCNLIFPGSQFCTTMQAKCENLWCTKAKPSDGCRSRGFPMADGTKCAENKWCIHQKCVEKGSRPAAVNGGWGAWGPMSTCSRTCGGGIKVAERECDKPVPTNGGRYCIGERKKITFCNTTPCDVYKPSFRGVQCSMYDNIQVTKDGIHKWSPYLSEANDPCALYCVSEQNVVVKVAPSVNDSTPCKPGTNHVCISGACRRVGCDWVLDSNTIEDKCGICKGDGTRCKTVEGFYIEKKGKSAIQKIVTVPKNARNIHLLEDKPHENYLLVEFDKNRTSCLNSRTREERSGDYLCANAVIIYTHPEPDKEEIQIKGPISEDLLFEYAFVDPVNIGVHYSYSITSDDPSYVPKYTWDFMEWSECNARCGGGTMISEATCIEENGGAVSPNFCQGTPKPEPKSQTCNNDPCPAKWRVSQWSKCNACDGKNGLKHRKVQCVRPAARFGEDDVQANFNACKGRVPKQKDDCVGKRPCKKTCPKKARNANRELEAENEKQSTSVEDQAKMIDRFVDLSLARYLEKAHGISRDDDELTRASDTADFRQLLRDWSIGEDKKKRSDCAPMNLTTLKPGSIILDPVPIENVVVIEAPTMEEGLQANISDRAYQESGDLIGVSIDTSREKVYRGQDAANKLNEVNIENKYPNATYVPHSNQENYTYDRLTSIVDAVDQ